MFARRWSYSKQAVPGTTCVVHLPVAASETGRFGAIGGAYIPGGAIGGGIVPDGAAIDNLGAASR